MAEIYIRDAVVFGSHFWAFYRAQSKEVQSKIDWVIGLVRTIKIVPEKYLKHLEGTDGLFEMRIKVGSNIYRIFCCFDKGNLVILFNGFQKKTDQTPPQEIIRAEKLKKLYYESKKTK